MSKSHFDTVIIGGGFTGMALSRYLQQSKIDHVVLEQINVVGSFLHQTWDNFRFGMTIQDFKLPDLDISKQFPAGHRLSRDEALKIVEEYVAKHKLPIRLNTKVQDLSKDAKDIFHLDLGKEKITANRVVICTGPHHAAKFPKWAIPFQHKATVISRYKNANHFKENARVLIIGSGLSALTIAHDLKTDLKKPMHVSIACAYNDEKIEELNSHLMKDKPQHLMKLLPSQLAKIGIFNFGRVVKNNGKEIVFQTKLAEYQFPSSYFDHIILATGFTYSFSLFKNFPLKQKNNLPQHHFCQTDISELYIAGIAHSGQKDRVVTITQGTQDAQRVHQYIRAKL